MYQQLPIPHIKKENNPLWSLYEKIPLDLCGRRCQRILLWLEVYLLFPQRLNGFHSDLSQQVKDMQTNLAKALAVNANLVNLYTAKVSECDLLKFEIEKLKDVIVKQSNGDIAIPSIYGGKHTDPILMLSNQNQLNHY